MGVENARSVIALYVHAVRRTSLSLISGVKSCKTIAQGERIIWRRYDLQHISYVVFRNASLSRTLEDGRTQMVGLLLPSDFIGSPGRERVDFDVTAVANVTLYRFDRTSFEKLVQDVPHIS